MYLLMCSCVCNNSVKEDCSEVKCAKVIHDIFSKLRGLCDARDGLKQYRYRSRFTCNISVSCTELYMIPSVYYLVVI